METSAATLPRADAATAAGAAWLNDSFETLSRPAPGTSGQAGRIVRAYVPAIVAAGLESSPSIAPELAEYVAAGMGRVDGLGTGWDHGFGAAHEALAADAGLEAALAEVALHLAAQGVAGRWSISAATSRRWRFANLLLPETDRLGVESEEGRASIRVGEAGPILRLRGRAMDWRPEEEGDANRAGCRLLPPLRPDGRQATAAVCAGRGLFPFDAEVAPMLIDDPMPDWLIERLEEAFAQLAAGAPAYLPWVKDVLRVLVPCRAQPDTLSSGSSSRMPGVIRVTAEQRPEALVEMLVHEASHQYFYLAGLTGDFADPADERLFWSPAKEKGRPIDRILLAYHAFANVEAVFAGCLAGGIGGSHYYAAQFERLVAQLDLMETHLLGAGTLTPLGWALAEPLIARRGRHPGR